MKQIITCLLSFLLAISTYGQQLPDSVLTKYKAAKTDEQRGQCLFTYLRSIPITDSNSVKKTLDLFSWFKQDNDEVGSDYTNLFIANFLAKKADFAAALNICFNILSRFEKRKDDYGILQANSYIGSVYFMAKEYEQAENYSKKALALMPAVTEEDIARISREYNSIGCIYGEAGHADSGMLYAQKAVNKDTELKNYQQLALSISTLAENYIAAKQYDIALPFLLRSLSYYESNQAKPTNTHLAYLFNDFAQVFLETKKYDSTKYYSHKALEQSIPVNYNDQSIRSYEYLYKSFEATKHEDSVNIYFRLAMTTKDSLFNLEKTKNIEALSFREQIRQQELETEKVKAEEARKQNIEYALMALGIVSFIILFLLMSRSFITDAKAIEYLGVIALLLVFEFLNLLLHPFLEKITNESPVLMLLALVCIAAVLVPLHHKLEHSTTSKLVEKNKAIRIASAKKTIEKLEGTPAKS